MARGAGNTDWDDLDDALIPACSTHAACALFGNGGVPLHIGTTYQFRAHVKRHHRAGLGVGVLEAWPCTDREDVTR